MKSLSTFILLFITLSPVFAQRFYPSGTQSRERIAIGLGSATYMGDLQESSLPTSTPNLMLSYEYQWTPRWALRADGLVYRIAASDANSLDPGRAARNLSFFSNNLELSGSIMLFLFRELPAAYSQRRKLNMYALLGFGATWFNPQAQLNGKTYNLRKYQTEGVAYGRLSPVIPSGMGLMAKVSQRLNIAMEVTYRISFTDYLDDVSSQYIARENFTSEVAATLADRRIEKGLEPAAAGSRRGNPALKDGYALYNIRLSYYLNSMYYGAKDRKKKLIR
ncbi:DUF6089 family protein [Nafulsella turpanensis]|uniref:DUF6089 family protein n=1 Tax=Nafulsella turpanensis TaxID=1265690 RepID=UPI0003461BFF|nr:DUF6089 family protein [Nafulsella turpanensis]